MAETQVSIRIDLESGGRIGPGKIALLEAIHKAGSIRAAAQSMKISYGKAWLLVGELNKLLVEPVVTTAPGGATVTPVGEKIIVLYHSIETHTRAAARSEFRAFRKIDARLSAGRERNGWPSRQLSVLLATLSDLSRGAPNALCRASRAGRVGRFMLLAGEGCPYLVELLPSGLRVPKPEPASSSRPSELHVASGEFSGSGAGCGSGRK